MNQASLRVPFLLAALLLALPLAAGAKWNPLPADAWSIKAGDPRAPKGALVLEERFILNTHDVEWYYRVRIVSEEGRRAASIMAFPENPVELEGRTLYPDGRITVFNSNKDFKTETRQVGYRRTRTKHVIPPGVTQDCVVEIYYREKMKWFGIRQWLHGLMRPWPIQKMVFQVDNQFPISWSLQGVNRIRPDVNLIGGARLFVFRDMPAKEEGPYILEPGLDLPTVFIYSNDFLMAYDEKAGPDAYWPKVLDKWYKPFLDGRLSLGSRYKAFSKELQADLPPYPQEAAKELIRRAHARLVNFEHLTWEDKEKLKAAGLKAPEIIHGTDLGDTLKYGGTDDWGWTWLGWRLLEDAGLKPKLLGVCDRERWIFRWGFLNGNQIHAHLLGVDEPGRETLWIDPTHPLLEPGLLASNVQGTPALLVDVPQGTVRQHMLPAQPAEASAQTYAYEVGVQGDRLAFSMQGSATGQVAFAAREELGAEEPDGRDKAFRLEFGERAKGWTLTEAKVGQAAVADKPLTWSAKGWKEFEEDRQIRLNPFPGLAAHLDMPDAWPEQRRARIVLPYRSVFKAACEVKAPKGYRIPRQMGSDQGNLFGRVSWTFVPSDSETEARILLEMNLRSLGAGPENYEAFKAYTGWIQEALNRTVILEKVK